MSKKNIKREIHVPKAENVRDETSKKQLINCIDAIEAAKRDGKTSCYILASSKGDLTTDVKIKLLTAGYDLLWKRYDFDCTHFIVAIWDNSATGKIIFDK